MAIKLGALKLFGFGGGKTAKPQAVPIAARPAAASRAGFMSRPLPLLGRLRIGTQLQILITALVAFLLVDAVVVASDAREGNVGTVYIATVGKIRMLSQRLAKAAQQASQGNREAFKQLRDSRDEFASQVRTLQSGGVASGVDLPPTSERVR